MIDAVDSARLEALCLLGVEQADRDADLEGMQVFDFRDDFFEGIEFPLGGSAARQDNAVGARLTVFGRLGPGKQFFTIQEVMCLEVGL